MTREIEISVLDLRFESHRMKHSGIEGRLLQSILERGIEEPLEGVDVGDRSVLLNGFKRYRCARKLNIEKVKYISLGQDEAEGIMSLLRTSNNKSLSMLEQAGFLDELKTTGKMSVAEIAADLGVSKAWVSVRLGIIAEMGPTVRRELFKGTFPVYVYMYSLRQLMRLNRVPKEQIEQFVVAVSGKKLSVRDLEQLAHGFFRGPESFRQEILKGNLALPLERMKQGPSDPDGCNEYERVLLKDLEITQKYMQRVMGKSQSPQIKTRDFCAQSNLLTAGILSRAPAFFQTLRQLHDRTGQA
jgi:predicted transcriptional regulator